MNEPLTLSLSLSLGEDIWEGERKKALASSSSVHKHWLNPQFAPFFLSSSGRPRKKRHSHFLVENAADERVNEWNALPQHTAAHPHALAVVWILCLPTAAAIQHARNCLTFGKSFFSSSRCESKKEQTGPKNVQSYQQIKVDHRTMKFNRTFVKELFSGSDSKNICPTFFTFMYTSAACTVWLVYL